MAKASQKFKSKAIANQHGQGASYEQEASYDDSLLPEAVELQKLQAIDPNIMDWIKVRTEKEQDMRHEFTRRKLTLVEKGQKMAYNVDRITVSFAFLLMIAGMAISGCLLYYGHLVEGSIFGGTTLFFAVKSFLNFNKDVAKPEKKESPK